MPEITEIDRVVIASTMQRARIPGVSVAYFDGKTHTLSTTTIGITDKHATPAEGPVRPDTVFCAASLSKPVFAYLVLKLIDKGMLSRSGESAASGLDRPLHEILPLENFFRAHGKELSAEDIERAKAITPRMLLSHTSGLGIDDSAALSFKPGREFAYSGMGLMYLQNVIKQVTDQSLETLAQNNVFQPLGMLHSSFLPPDRPGYMAQTISSHAKSKETPKTPNAANSVHTTASDYAKLMTAWMRDPSPIMKQAFVPQINLTQDNQKLPGESEPAAKDVPEEDKARLAWGLGLGLELDKTGEAAKAFHTGDMNQYRSQVALNLKDKSCIVYFANGRDHREANGHILGPLIISPKIPVPHAHTWFYEKFRFAKSVDELIGGPHFGLRSPKPKKADSYAVMAAMMPKRTPAPEPSPHETRKKSDVESSHEKIDEEERQEETNRPASPSPFKMTP